MIKNETKKVIFLAAINSVLAILTGFFLVGLYFRVELDLTVDIYASLGWVNISFFSALLLVMIESLMKVVYNNQNNKFDKIKIAFVIAFPSLATLVGLYLVAIILDPWLTISIVSRMILWGGGAFVVLGSALFILFYRSASANDFSDKSNWQKLTTVISERSMTLIILVILFITGIFLRNMTVASYAPAVDEFPHLRHAIMFLRNEPITYFRAFWTVTGPLILLFKTFGIDLDLARMLMASFNMIAIIPLYFFMRRFGRGTALFAVLLFVVSPQIMAMSNVIRDYSVAGIFIYLTYWITSRLVTSEMDGSLRNWIKANYIDILITLLLFSFALSDQLSIVSVIIGNILVFSGIMFLKILTQYNGSKIKMLLLSIALFGFAVILLLTADKIRLSDLNITTKFFHMLTENEQVNWSYALPQIGWLFLAYSVIALMVNLFRSNTGNGRLQVYISATFLGLILYSSIFLLGGKLGVRSRYNVVFLYYLIPIVAIIFSKIFNWVREKLWAPFNKFGSLSTIWFVLALLVFVVNIPSINYIRKFDGGKNLVSGMDHFIFEPSYEYLKKHISDGDVIIADQLNKYDLLYDNIFDGHDVLSTKVFNTNYSSVSENLEPYNHGWVAKSKNGILWPKGFAGLNDAEIEGIDFEFIGRFGDIALWRFEK